MPIGAWVWAIPVGVLVLVSLPIALGVVRRRRRRTRLRRLDAASMRRTKSAGKQSTSGGSDVSVVGPLLRGLGPFEPAEGLAVGPLLGRGGYGRVYKCACRVLWWMLFILLFCFFLFLLPFCFSFFLHVEMGTGRCCTLGRQCALLQLYTLRGSTEFVILLHTAIPVHIHMTGKWRGALVAVKIVELDRRAAAHLQASKDAITDEMRACIRAKHPNVVQTYRIWVQGAGTGQPLAPDANAPAAQGAH